MLGHEAVGVVEAVGGGVRRIRPGDRVVASFDIACGACWFCERGQTSLCEDFMNLGAGAFGGGLPGAQAEHVRIPVADVNLLEVPDDVDDEHALFVGDVATTGLFAAGLASIGPGTSVAVLGVGPVGFFAIQAARNRGATVFGVDREPARLALAAAAGAEPIDARAVHAPMALAERTGDRGPDVVIEAVGTPEAYETAVEMVRRGGEVIVVGMYAGRIGRGPARGVLGARAHRPVRRHLPGARVVGAGDAGRSGRAAGSGAADQPSSAAGRGGGGVRVVRPP